MVSGRSAVFDTLLESDDDGYSGSGEPSSVGLPDPSAQAQQHLARQLTQVLRNLRDRMCGDGDCPPCKPYPLGSIGYQGPEVHQTGIDAGMLHYHLYEVQQIPSSCKCIWREATKRITGSHHYDQQPNNAVGVNLNGSGRPPNYPQ